MAIVDMRRITIIGLIEYQSLILESLMKQGAVEIENIQGKSLQEEWSGLIEKDGQEDKLSELDSKLSVITSAINHLSRYSIKKKVLFQSKRLLDYKEYLSILEKKAEIWNITEKINNYDCELASLRAEENRLMNLITALKPWKSLEIPLNFESTKKTFAVSGTLPSAVDSGKLLEILLAKVPFCHVNIIGSDKEQTYMFVLCHKDSEETCMEILKGNGFTKVTFKELTGNPKEVINNTEIRISEIEKERTLIENKIADFSAEKANIEVLYDYYQIKRDRIATLNNMVKTEKTFILEGWIPAVSSNSVQKELSSQWDAIVMTREPEKEEEFPILLKNSTIVKPFEVVTELYSLPHSRGVDPNLIMSPFYFAFFGLMVSDAGYGLIMALLTGIILLKYKPAGMAGKLLGLIFLGGVSTFIWGALFGSWFGDTVDQISKMITGQSISIPPLWFNPLNDPMRLLIWSLIFGAVHLFTGMGIRAYELIKAGDYKDAIFDVGFWYVFLIGLAMLLIGGKTGEFGKYMAVGGAVLLVLTQGRNKKSIIAKFLSGLLSLYNVTGYLSDILSYSRLLALGLATGVIASVINTVGVLFGFNFIGIVLLIFVFIVGHVFNILINALGAYVHASRLQYVEFFSKFYEGGGRSFRPFKIKTKYINFN